MTNLFLNFALASTPRTTTTVRFGQRWASAISIERHTRVMTVQDAESGALDIGIRINVGYYADPTDYAGLAHMVEHLLIAGKARPYAEPLHDWIRLSQSRKLHCKTFEDHTDCFLSAEIGEAQELLKRVATAFAPKQYSAADIERQLRDIEHERRAYNSSDDGMESAFESNLINPRHPASRVFSSGDVKTLKHAAPADLLAAAQALLADHYWGREADVVLIGPWSPDKSLAFARRNLLNAFGPVPCHSSAPAIHDTRPFDELQTASLHETHRSSPDDLIVLAYSLPTATLQDASTPERFRAFDLLQFNFQDTGPQSLYGELVARFRVRSLWVEAMPGKYGDSDSLRLEIERDAGSSESVDDLQAAIEKFMRSLESRPRADTVRHYQSVVGLGGLIAPKPNRDDLVFDALDEIDSDRTTGAFDYAAEVSDRDWEAYRALIATVQAAEPLRILFHGSAPSAAAAPNPATVEPAPPATGEVALGTIAAAADCIATDRSGTRQCLNELWSVSGIRSTQPFDTALQRTLAQALLGQTQRLVNAQLPDLSQYGNALEVTAGATPSIGLVGHLGNPSAVLQRTWQELLRERTSEELNSLQHDLAYAPENAFDWSMDAASDGLSITNRAEARKLVAESTLKREVQRLQQAIRSAPIEHYGPHAPSDLLPVTANDARPTIPLKVAAGVSFAPGTLLEMRCGSPTNELLTMLRLAALPSHKLFLNAARASGDTAAFGVFAVREWGADKCFGASMDSGTLDSDQLRAAVGALSIRREQLFCTMTSRAWQDTKQWVLANEGLPWADEQAYAVEDLRNWMQYGPGLLPARQISKRAAALSSQQVCSWVKNEGAVSSNSARSIEIAVPPAH